MVGLDLIENDREELIKNMVEGEFGENAQEMNIH